jgi:integrase
VILHGNQVRVDGQELPPASAAEQARQPADSERLEHENLALRAEVKKLRRQLEDALGRKVRTGPAPTLQDAITTWLANFKGRTPNTVSTAKSNLERFKRKFGPQTSVDDLEGREREIDGWLRSLKLTHGDSKGTPVGPEMRKKMRHHVLTLLTDSGISINRKLIKAPTSTEVRCYRGSIVWLERKEAEALASALPPYWNDLFRIQVATGLRPNEIRAGTSTRRSQRPIQIGVRESIPATRPRRGGQGAKDT